MGALTRPMVIVTVASWTPFPLKLTTRNCTSRHIRCSDIAKTRPNSASSVLSAYQRAGLERLTKLCVRRRWQHDLGAPRMVVAKQLQRVPEHCIAVHTAWEKSESDRADNVRAGASACVYQSQAGV
jgi:hypothetical protein